MRATLTAPTTRATGQSPSVARRPSPVSLAPDVAAVLLRLARAAVAATASGRLRMADLAGILPHDPPRDLLTPAAAFVTLRLDGELRGCTGYLEGGRPLWETVVSAAVGAASSDPRFWPVTEREVPALSIDVSVLGPMIPLVDPSAFRPGVDGVVVERGTRRGLLLPEVATDQGWGLREMLETTCRKAGLPADAWRDPGTRVFVFRTARVSETRAGGRLDRD